MRPNQSKQTVINLVKVHIQTLKAYQNNTLKPRQLKHGGFNMFTEFGVNTITESFDFMPAYTPAQMSQIEDTILNETNLYLDEESLHVCSVKPYPHHFDNDTDQTTATLTYLNALLQQFVQIQQQPC